MQEKRQEDYANEVLTGYILTSLLVLGDKFGFGKERLTRFLNYIADDTKLFKDESKNGTVTTRDDIKKVLKDEYKFDFDACLNEIYKKIEG